IPHPAPGPGEALVAVAYAGVNFIDTYLRSGLYPAGDLPVIAGREGAGTVEALGPGVAGIGVGDRVAFVDAPGSYAERVALPAGRLFPLPDGLSFETGAALPLQGLTADYLVHTVGAIGPGSTVLIHAAAGGVGLLATQLAKRAGATVYGTCSTAAKAAAARRAGCDEVILYTEADFADEVLRLTDGRGCDVVLDSVGRATFAGSVRSTGVRGTLCVFGQSSGMIEPFSPRPVLGSRTLVSATLFDYLRDPEERAERWGRVAGLAARGRLEVAIDRVHPLAEAALAHRRLEGRETSGKLLMATA
ncbi:MAG TPA: quinone oxidoreductase, partial [Thermoanaerobaculia bacterium]|nr:quinone oxidoreductase [Thermoanaerobaculia bacterium]